MKHRMILSAMLLAATLAVGCGESAKQAAEAHTAALAEDEQATYEYVVPFGTGRSIDRGEVIEIMPPTLQVTVGESIRIVNKDIRGYDIGPFHVGALQTLAMRFTHPGRISGVCAVNAEGEFVVEVTE